MGTGARDWAILQSTGSPPSASTGVTVGYISRAQCFPWRGLGGSQQCGDCGRMIGCGFREYLSLSAVNLLPSHSMGRIHPFVLVWCENKSS